ncbi:hypothetical protein G5C65_23305 [Streptomyces sp. SB3404]|uniref:DUF4232 domain-containing protein n=1 Tax=Streptomyces boncukensis TaxID=2711219 RepID=A0A6G4X164_9ACTN|nr:hypothetical protein [Streptomyces boncukensis]
MDPDAVPARGVTDPVAFEDELRQLLKHSVRGIEPSAESLDALQRAVPARRTHRRQVLMGAVAAALVVIVGIPAVLFSGVVSGDREKERPVTAASSHGPHKDRSGEKPRSGASRDEEKKDRRQKKDHKEKDRSPGSSSDPSAPSGGQGESSGANPHDTLAASAPTCGRNQLGNGTAQSGAPDAQGRVYGSFRVTNTSGDACTVDGEGVVGATTQGVSMARARVQIVDHTSGDPATGLPDPSAESDRLVLGPGHSYVVRFAWIPTSGNPCVTSPPEPETSQDGATGDGARDEPSAGAGENGGQDSAGGADSGGGPGGGESSGGDGDGGGDGGTGDAPKVVISHTPDVGTPAVADTVLDGACGGTVYRTGVLPAQ